MSKQKRSGGYRTRLPFQAVTLIYDATWWFCETFLKDRPATANPMLQAARECRHFLAEAGRTASRGINRDWELELFERARTRLEELLLDFEDFLRHRRLTQWTLDSPELTAIRSVARRPKEAATNPGAPSSNESDLSKLTDQQRWMLYARWLEHSDSAVRANAIICLIHQASFLLDQRIATLSGNERSQCFGANGDSAESVPPVTTVSHETSHHPVAAPAPFVAPVVSPSTLVASAEPSTATASITGPRCPKCGKQMALRTAKQGRKAGQEFWGCTGYPDCKETARV